RHRRREQLVDRAGEFGEVDAEGGVEDRLGEQAEHDQPRHDEGAIGDAVDLGHAAADGRAEDHEIQGGGDHRRDHRLPQGAQGAGHLEAVDGPDAVTVEAHHAASPCDPWTRPTKISSSELCRVDRSLKPTPRSLMRRSREGTPVRSALESNTYSISCPSAFSSSGHSPSSGGSAASGSWSCRVRVFLPSFFISSALSSTRISSPFRITPTRSAISSASSM